MLARGLFPERLQGDEPEQPEVVMWPLESVDDLFFSSEISEERSMAAIRMAQLHNAGETDRARCARGTGAPRWI